MHFEKAVGLEAEFFLGNEAGEVIVPPSHMDRDDFPLQGEVRAKPGKSAPETLANFVHQQMVVESGLPHGHSMRFSSIETVKLATYQKALAECETPKGKALRDIRNVHGTDISGFSDQIIRDGKIQGVRASCGLHIHFSCRAVDRFDVSEPEYTHVELPLRMEEGAQEGHKALIRPYISLYKRGDYKVRKTLEASASALNRPTVEWMVRELDSRFFDKFAPQKAERTKYRQPGFYELKPYGFEYRSLAANQDTIEALPEIVEAAFELLKCASEYA